MAVPYWQIGLQYVGLTQIASEANVLHGNKWIVFSDVVESEDEYFLQTQWSDFAIGIPVLFNFYHGLEVILKGFLVAIDGQPRKNHNLSKLVVEFEKYFHGDQIALIVRRYIDACHLHEIIASFCNASGLADMANCSQVLRYPATYCKNQIVPFDHNPLKYNGEDGALFFRELATDAVSLRLHTVSLARYLEP